MITDLFHGLVRLLGTVSWAPPDPNARPETVLFLYLDDTVFSQHYVEVEVRPDDALLAPWAIVESFAVPTLTALSPVDIATTAMEEAFPGMRWGLSGPHVFEDPVIKERLYKLCTLRRSGRDGRWVHHFDTTH